MSTGWEPSSALNQHIKDTADYRLLTAEEEVELSKCIQDCDERLEKNKNDLQAKKERAAAIEKFTLANLRLVFSIALKFRVKTEKSVSLELADLVQEGYCGLLKAIEEFRWQYGNKFSTYAKWWIFQVISNAVHHQANTIRRPNHIGDASPKVYKARNELHQEGVEAPSINEIAKHAGVSESVASSVLWYDSISAVSLDKPDSTDKTLAEKVSDTLGAPEQDFLQGYVKQCIHQRIHEMLGTLDTNEADVIKLRFGLDDQILSYEKIARKLSFRTRKIRELEAVALGKLREKFGSEIQSYIEP